MGIYTTKPKSGRPVNTEQAKKTRTKTMVEAAKKRAMQAAKPKGASRAAAGLAGTGVMKARKPYAKTSR